MMKNILVGTMLMGLFSMSVYAVEVELDHLMFPEDVNEAIRLAEEREATSLNGSLTADRKDYAADEAWVGTTKKEKDCLHPER